MATLAMPPGNLGAPVFYSQKEFTFITTGEYVGTLLPDVTLKSRKSIDKRIELTYPDGTPVAGRALICKCGEGNYWSVTFRPMGPKPPLTGNQVILEDQLPQNNFRASETSDPNYLNPLSVIVDTLNTLIFDVASCPTGLVVVAGATGSGKSEIARGLIERYLSSKGAIDQFDRGKKRRRHLITFEDPIEKYLFDTWPLDNHAVDYTPRQKGEDLRNLKLFLADARRQTPAVAFVGETREQEDWRELVNFAGSGHLAITTTHSNSLTELMGLILDASGVRTPADRNSVGNRLLALIQVSAYQVTASDGKQVSATIPAVWRGNNCSRQKLMSDGKASLLPEFPKEETAGALQKGGWTVLGRQWFARCFLNRAGVQDPKFFRGMVVRDLEEV